MYFYRLEGQMVETARAHNKPVVNVQWLNDILFGAEIGIKDPTNIKYQQFDLSDPFSINYDMVSHLMGMLLHIIVFYIMEIFNYLKSISIRVLYFIKKCLTLVNPNYYFHYFLEGWKTPVVYLKNKRVYDLTSPSKYKKLKTEIEDQDCIDLSDDDDDDFDDDDDNIVITYINRSKPCIMLSGFTVEEKTEKLQVFSNVILLYFM